MSKFEFYKKRDAGQIVQDLIGFYLANFKEIININLPFAVITTVFTYFYLDEFLSKVNPQDLTSFADFAEFDFGSIALIMMFSLIASVFQVALNIEFIHLKVNEVQYSFKLIYENSFRNFYKYIVWSILGVMILIIVTLIGIIPIIGWVFFFYVIVSITPLFYVLKFEHLNFFDGIKQCFYIVKNKWWTAFGSLFIIGLILFLISMAVSIVLAAIFGVNIFTPEAYDSNYFVVNSIGGLINNILGISMQFVPAFLYFTFSKKDKDLMNRISEIGED